VEKELNALVDMSAWDLFPLPNNSTALPCKWVFKGKLNADGSIERYKARLVIQGFRQRYGIDYVDVFAPVVRASTVRWFFSLVASADLECHTIDIKNAFIQSTLDESSQNHRETDPEIP
jgi:Reverse transcriptase (RNA-dependent DNA polymerase)